MAQRDPNTLDLSQQTIRIAEDVMFWPVRERGELVYRMEIPKLHRFFRVGYEEYVLISLLNGKTTIPQACGLAAAKLGNRAPTAAQAGAIGRWLLSNELAYLESDGPPVRRVSSSDTPNQNRQSGWFTRLNPFWIKIPFPRSERWIRPSAKIMRPLFAMPVVMMGMLVLAIATLVLAARWDEFSLSSASFFHPNNWIWLVSSWIGLKIVHEFAHAVACARAGGEVRESGIVLVLFAPLAYVDVTSCWRMDSRWSRIAVAAAGMYVELVIAATAMLLWTVVDDPLARFLLHNLVVAAGLSTLLFNANVLMRFDGYFILADLIEIPNLYAEASGSLRRLTHRWVTGEETAPVTSLIGWRRHFVLSYGIAALLWRVAVCVSLGIAASTMFAGAGIAIAALGLCMWLGRPLLQLRTYAAELRGRDPIRFARAGVISVAGLCGCCWLVFWLPIPTSVTVPATATYLPDTIVRSRASGFVTRVLVADGSQVREGDLMLEIENRDLRNQAQQLDITRQQNEIRLRQATDRHDAGARQIVQENQKAVVEQLAQIRGQMSGLKVVAPRTGRVVAPGLASRLGTYVEEGDSLLVLANETDKELVAVIAQDLVKEVRPAVGKTLQITTAHHDRVDGTLDRIEPRASDRLPDAALAAPEGGSLVVQDQGVRDEVQEYRLLQPHFLGRISLTAPVAAEIRAGMRVQASVGYRTEPIASRMRRAIRRLWYAALDDSQVY